MSENMPTNVQLDTNQNGSVTFATEVVATIAGLAATEVEGVASMGGSTGASFADILTRRGSSSRNLTRGVKVEVSGNTVSVQINIVVDYGSPVPEVAFNIQENVKKAVETMSGLSVSNVDVHVEGISFERENKAAAQIEAQPRILLQKQTAKQPDDDKPEEPSADAPEGETTDDVQADQPDQAQEAAPESAPELNQTDDHPDDER